MAAKKLAKKKAARNQYYNAFVQWMIGIFVLLSFVFLATAYWRYG